MTEAICGYDERTLEWADSTLSQAAPKSKLSGLAAELKLMLLEAVAQVASSKAGSYKMAMSGWIAPYLSEQAKPLTLALGLLHRHGVDVHSIPMLPAALEAHEPAAAALDIADDAEPTSGEHVEPPAADSLAFEQQALF